LTDFGKSLTQLLKEEKKFFPSFFSVSVFILLFFSYKRIKEMLLTEGIDIGIERKRGYIKKKQHTGIRDSERAIY
jgi:hypothetical protein